MKELNGNAEVKRINQRKIVRYLLNHGSASRQEIAANIGLSMPTALQIVNKLIENEFVCEVGEYGSTGGRRAKILSLRESKYCAIGVEITKNHVLLILLDMTKKLLDIERLRFPYENTPAYYMQLGNTIEAFWAKNQKQRNPENVPQLVGVGFSLPGTIRQDTGVLWRSLQMNVSDVSLQRFLQCVPYPTRCGNNAMNATYAEVDDKEKNILYLSLNDIVGGGAYLDGRNYSYGNAKSTLFGHLIIEPRGKACYCGKCGCLNAYCSALVLTKNGTQTLAQFFSDMEDGSKENVQIWNEYIDYLAVAVSNLRAIFGCDIIIGGAVSRFLKKYTSIFEEKLMQYSLFEYDVSYIKFGKYDQEAAAVGIAQEVIEEFLFEGTMLDEIYG